MTLPPRPFANIPAFEWFIPTRTSTRALRLCRQMARSPAPLPALVLHGPTGVGKTHLIRATANGFLRRSPLARVRLTSANELAREVVVAVRADRLLEFEMALTSFDLIVVDDLHFLIGREGTEAALGAALRNCVTAGARVIGAGTMTARDLKIFRQKFGGVRLCSMASPSRRDVRALVAAFAQRQSITIAPRTMRRLVPAIGADVRRAMGAVTHLVAISTLPAGPREPPWLADLTN